MTTTTKPRTENIPIGEAAKRLGLSRGALQLRIHRGTFPIESIQYTDGGRRYFPADEIDALAASGLAGLEAFRQMKYFKPRHISGLTLVGAF